ncbi:MAG: hypothetical protein JWN01_216 [Patescibacteria group bacterium]|nr:hypothetical protein [Patescibacteria group bacterium]
MEAERARSIATLNDAFRRGGFGVVVTCGVKELDDVAGLLRAVRTFDAFTEANDPHGEHDFGSIVWKGKGVLWRIDYYDREWKSGEDALSRNCRWILTVMLASEY